MPSKILVVEDDVHLSRTIAQLMRDVNDIPLVAHTAEDGLSLARQETPDLVLLDIMVPNMGGWELCRLLRRFTDAPIIFMTALGDTEDIVRGLNLGADDYIAKPFDQAELLARVKAHLRRHVGRLTDKFVFGDDEIIVDLANHEVIIRGEEVEFTPREYALLSVLVRNAGRTVRTEDLLELAWGKNYVDAKRNLKPYIHYLRKKVERDSASPYWITTVRGIGYRFSEA